MVMEVRCYIGKSVERSDRETFRGTTSGFTLIEGGKLSMSSGLMDGFWATSGKQYFQ
jgi:hypothetical protein